MARLETEETWSIPVDDVDLTETLRVSEEVLEDEVTVPLEGLSIGEVLGEGGMGRVSLGSQGRLRREVAVKELKPGVDPRIARSLLREAWVTGALEHPNIVPVHDLLEDEDGHPQIVLKRIEGIEWQAYLDGDAALPAEAEHDPLAWHLGVLSQVCNALEFAHQRGIVHRDLKPENVMVGAFGEVYVLDWGIAMGVRPDPRGRFPLASDQKAMVGTPLYMAPEMFVRDATRVMAETDIYLMGGMLFRVLAGHPPRRGETLQEIADEAKQMPPLDPSWPSDLLALLEASFQQDPIRRPGAGSFRRALRAHLSRRGLERLYVRAAERFAELQLLLAQEPEDADAHHLTVHDALGGVRFGLQEVLAGWPEHPKAKPLLQQVYADMLAYAMHRGDGQAARLWLGRMEAPTLAQASAVDDLVKRADADREQLERLTADLDRSTGFYARAFMLVLLAGTWVGLPLFLTVLGWQLDYLRSVLQFGLTLVVLLLCMVPFWRSIRSSRTNRGFLVLALLSTTFSLIAMLLGWRWDLPIGHAMLVKAACDALLVCVAALLFEVMLLPAAALYVGVVVAGIFLPDWANLMSRGATLFMVCNALAAWPWIRGRH